MSILHSGTALQVAGLQPGVSPPPRGTSQTELARGQFVLQDVEGDDALQQGKASTIVARVGSSSWAIDPGSGVLRLGELSFAFSLPAHPTHQLVLILSADTQPEAVGLLEAILESVALYTEAHRALGDGDVKAGEARKAAELAASAQEAAAAPPFRYESRAARGVQRAASSAASGVMVSAVWACDMMQSTSKRWRQGDPAPQPVRFSAGFHRRLKRTADTAQWASRATHVAGSGLGWLASRVLGAGLWLAGLTRSTGAPPGAARETTHAAAIGIDQVWETLEEAGCLVLTTAKASATEVAQHKYGAEAAEAAASGMRAAVCSVETVVNMSGRATARRAARATARDVLRKVAATKVG